MTGHGTAVHLCWLNRSGDCRYGPHPAAAAAAGAASVHTGNHAGQPSPDGSFGSMSTQPQPGRTESMIAGTRRALRPGARPPAPTITAPTGTANGDVCCQRAPRQQPPPDSRWPTACRRPASGFPSTLPSGQPGTEQGGNSLFQNESRRGCVHASSTCPGSSRARPAPSNPEPADLTQMVSSGGVCVIDTLHVSDQRPGEWIETTVDRTYGVGRATDVVSGRKALLVAGRTRQSVWFFRIRCRPARQSHPAIRRPGYGQTKGWQRRVSL